MLALSVGDLQEESAIYCRTKPFYSCCLFHSHSCDVNKDVSKLNLCHKSNVNDNSCRNAN